MNDTDAEKARAARLDVAELILRERLARDNREWSRMAACYHPDSFVDVSWFQGSGADFIAATERNAASGPLNFHVMSPPVVSCRGDRAIAETPCSLRSFMRFDDIDVSHEGFVRLLWRAQRLDGRWLISGLRCIYVRDLLHACDPSRPPKLDYEALMAFRPSYRFLSYNLTRRGLSPRDDLPGEDRPETVTVLRAAEQSWLAQ